MAGSPEYPIGYHIYTVLTGPGLCHPADIHFGLLLLGHTEVAHSWSQAQVQREEAVPSQGDKAGTDSDYRIYPVLATLLDIPGGLDNLDTGQMRLTSGDNHLSVGQLSGLLELGHESHTLCLSVGQL